MARESVCQLNRSGVGQITNKKLPDTVDYSRPNSFSAHTGTRHRARVDYCPVKPYLPQKEEKTPYSNNKPCQDYFVDPRKNLEPFLPSNSSQDTLPLNLVSIDPVP